MVLDSADGPYYNRPMPHDTTDADLLDFTMDTSHMTRGALGLPARAVELDPVAAKLEADRRAAPHIAEALAAKGKLPPG